MPGLLTMIIKDAFINGIVYGSNTDGPSGPINAPYIAWATKAIIYGENVQSGLGFDLYIKINKEPIIIKEIYSKLSIKETIFEGTIFERLNVLQEGLGDEIKEVLIDSTEEEYNNAWK